MKNRILSITLALALAIVLMVSALPVTQAQDEVRITFYRFFGACSDEYADVTDLAEATGECGIIQVMANKFNAENEMGIVVETQSVDWFTYYDQLTATYAGGSPPDIAVMHRSTLPNYASRGMVRPLGDDFAEIGIDVADFTETALNAATYNDTVFAMPFDVHAVLWHVNVDLMAEAGLVDDAGEPILPTSPEELLEHAAQVKDATGKMYMSIAGAEDPMAVRVFDALVWQQNSDIFSDDLSEATLDTEAGHNALDLLVALYENGYAAPEADYSASEQDFLAGEAAIMINGTWVVDSYTAQAANPDTPLQNYVVRNFPTLYETPATWSDSHMWVIPTQPNPDQDKYEASLQFLKYLYDNNFQWARTGHMSVRASVLGGEEYAALPHRTEYLETAEISKGVPAIQFQRGIQDIMAEELQSTWLTDKSVDAALADAEFRVTDLLDRARR